ncbi:hypothetical protein [Microbacterium sp. RU33B]|uniref:hypothetical protein n=1 Tax=Microbacterium sp. RU33B TaxID=1907390 RepID=UPI000967D464|nr:hypothetical protein [Microbacterium sp. RU33B]SIT72130.1 hypothetical protein SAMN05880545_1000 [Microbacterium sp. RU33B]
MDQNLTSTEKVLRLAPEGFSALAGLIDNSIQDAVYWLGKEREDFIDPYEAHTRIRGTILQAETHRNRRASSAAGKPTPLEELGIRLEGGPSLSIIARVVGAPGEIRIMQRPRTVVEVEMLGPEGLFEQDHGPLYLFYTERSGCLGSLTLVESYTDRNDFFLKGCEATDQHEVPLGAMVAPGSSTTTDELSEFFRQTTGQLTSDVDTERPDEIDTESESSVEDDELPREGTTDS